MMIKQNSDVYGLPAALLSTLWKKETKWLKDNKEETSSWKEKYPQNVKDFFFRKYLFFKCRCFSFQKISEKTDLILLFSWDSYGFKDIEANSLL